MQILESKIERDCKLIAENYGCILLKIQGVKGFPDRLLVGPHGQIMWMEFKKEGGTMSPIQKHIQMKMMRMGHRVEEVDSKQLFMGLLQNLGISTPVKKGETPWL